MTLTIRFEVISWVVSTLLGIGAGLYIFTALEGATDLIRKVVHRRRRNILGTIRRSEEVATKQIHRDELLGIADIPWARYYFLSASVGILLYLFVDVGVIYKFLYISFPLWVHVWRGYLRKQAERSLESQVRGFYNELRIVYSLRGTLLLSLIELARKPPEDNIIYRQLQDILSGSRQSEASSVLSILAKRLGSNRLEAFAEAADASVEGELDIDAYLKEQADLIADRLSNTLREELQAMPIRVVIFSVPFLLFPLLIMGISPLAERATSMISGFSGP